MLRLAADDPLLPSLFTKAQLAGVRKLSRIKRGKREGQLTTEQEIELGLESRGLDGFSRQYRFHVERLWRFDFAYVEQKVAVEYEGLVMRRVNGQWQTGGRHATITGMREDMAKYNAATILGWRVLRFELQSVRDGSIYDTVAQILGKA